MNPRGTGGNDAQRPVWQAAGRPPMQVECAVTAGLLSGCRVTACLVTACLVALAIGCDSPPPPLPPATQEEVRVMPAVSEDVREKLLDGAVAVLGRLTTVTT